MSTYAPAPGAAPLLRSVLAQAGWEARLLLRNGEQLLLVVLVPIGLLLLANSSSFLDLGPGRRIDVLAPGMLALAVLSTAFTGQAIATGFERRYGVLLRLAVSPLPRAGLIAGKTLAVLLVEAMQVVLLVALSVALGWRPDPTGIPAALVLMLLGTAALSGLALLMAGTLRAEATLAAANLLYLLMLVGGGVVVPLDRLPDGLATVLGALPVGLLTNGLRDALGEGSTPWASIVGLLAWAVVLCGAAARWFRWE